MAHAEVSMSPVSTSACGMSNNISNFSPWNVVIPQSLREHYWLWCSKVTICAFPCQVHKKLSNLSCSIELESWIRVFNYYFNYSAITSIIQLLNTRIFDYLTIRSFHYWIFEISIVQLFPHLERRPHPHPDWSPTHSWRDTFIHTQTLAPHTFRATPSARTTLKPPHTLRGAPSLTSKTDAFCPIIK